jgi:hypothetical protein
MTIDHGDTDLERRFRDALREVMPQLLPPPRELSAWDAHHRVDDADPLPNPKVSAVPVVRARRAASGRSPHQTLSVAAALIIVVGLGAALVLTLGRGSDETVPVATATPTTAVAAPADQAGGSLLSTPVPAGVEPMVVVGRDDWTLEGYAGPRSIASIVPSATCAGCGATRLIVAANGPLFSGPVLTAWSINDDYDVNEFDWPVTIGASAGRFIGSQDGTIPAHRNRVRVVWPLSPGRTAFVDAYGFTNEQVFEMAATLTFDSSIPVMADLPVGFSVVSTPTGAGFTEQIYNRFVGGPIDAEADGISVPVIELIVTNGGLQGLLDWRNPGGLVGSWGEPRTIDGVTVLLDRETDPNEPPILTISATWVVGDWSYTAIGHVFQTEAEFLDVIASLKLTDEPTFANATSIAHTYEFETLTPSVDGTTGVLGG